MSHFDKISCILLLPLNMSKLLLKGTSVLIPWNFDTTNDVNGTRFFKKWDLWNQISIIKPEPKI